MGGKGPWQPCGALRTRMGHERKHASKAFFPAEPCLTALPAAPAHTLQEELPLFLRHGRPQVVAPHKRVWPGVQNSPEADPMHPGHAPFTGHWRLRVRVPKPDSGGLRDCEVRAILAGGFWEPSSPKPKQQGGGHRVPRTTGPMGSSDGTQSLVAPIGGSSSVSLFMQARMRAMTAEADAALEMLRWKSRHAARSMRSSATGASHAAGHALARLAALLLCCCSRQVRQGRRGFGGRAVRGCWAGGCMHGCPACPCAKLPQGMRSGSLHEHANQPCMHAGRTVRR